MKSSKKTTEEQSQAAGSPSISPKAESEACIRPRRRAGWIQDSSGQMEADWRPEGPSDLEGLSSTIKNSFSVSVKNKGNFQTSPERLRTRRKSTFILLYHHRESGRRDSAAGRASPYWEKTSYTNRANTLPASATNFWDVLLFHKNKILRLMKSTVWICWCGTEERANLHVCFNSSNHHPLLYATSAFATVWIPANGFLQIRMLG